MVYVQGIHYISDTETCRRLARQVVPADFTDPQIQDWQYFNYSIIQTYTHKSDWDANDREFGALKGLETKLTASDIMEHYGDMSYQNNWESMRKDVYAQLVAISNNLSPGSDDSIDEGKFIISNDYVSYPNSLNDDQNAQPFRSTNISI